MQLRLSARAAANAFKFQEAAAKAQTAQVREIPYLTSIVSGTLTLILTLCETNPDHTRLLHWHKPAYSCPSLSCSYAVSRNPRVAHGTSRGAGLRFVLLMLSHLRVQVAALKQEVDALRTAIKPLAPPAPLGPGAAVWRLLLGAAAIAARAAAMATGALAMLYAAVALPGVRNALHGALAAGQPGTVRLPVLAVLGVAAFLATAVSVATGRAATARA